MRIRHQQFGLGNYSCITIRTNAVLAQYMPIRAATGGRVNEGTMYVYSCGRRYSSWVMREVIFFWGGWPEGAATEGAGR